MLHWVLFIQRTYFLFRLASRRGTCHHGSENVSSSCVEHSVTRWNGLFEASNGWLMWDKQKIPLQNTNKRIDFISEMRMSVQQSTESFKAAQQLIFRQKLNKFPVPFSSRGPITMITIPWSLIWVRSIQFLPWHTIHIQFLPWYSILIQILPWHSILIQFLPWQSTLIQCLLTFTLYPYDNVTS